MLGTIVFWGLAGLTIGSALLVALRSNVLHAAFALCMTFAGVAGLYVLLGAPFVAAVQIIVYVGGVVILVVFAVMFSSRLTEESRDTGRLNLAQGLIASVLVLSIILVVMGAVVWPVMRTRTGPDRQAPRDRWLVARMHYTVAQEDYRSAHKKWVKSGRQGAAPRPPLEGEGEARLRGLGSALLTRYVLPFEVTSVLLVAVMIGALVIVRKEIRPTDGSGD